MQLHTIIFTRCSTSQNSLRVEELGYTLKSYKTAHKLPELGLCTSTPFSDDQYTPRAKTLLYRHMCVPDSHSGPRVFLFRLNGAPGLTSPYFPIRLASPFMRWHTAARRARGCLCVSRVGADGWAEEWGVDWGGRSHVRRRTSGLYG